MQHAFLEDIVKIWPFHLTDMAKGGQESRTGGKKLVVVARADGDAKPCELSHHAVNFIVAKDCAEIVAVIVPAA